MSDLVYLEWKRNRGWPWPDDSWGLSPMYGEEGWCRSCGVPRGPQTGALVLRSRGFSASAGAWLPNWQFDAVCLGAALSAEVEARFPSVRLLPVQWRNGRLGRAAQIIPAAAGSDWFDTDELRGRVVSRHGAAGETCPACGVWRWYPLPWGELPPLRAVVPEDVLVAASPEWFGAGRQAFRQLVFRRPLAEMIAAASPRDVTVWSITLDHRRFGDAV